MCVCLSRVFWVYCSEYLQLNEDLQGNPLFDDKTMVESRIRKNHWHITSEVGVKHEIPKNRWWISSNIYRPLMNLNLTVTKCDKVGLTFTYRMFRLLPQTWSNYMPTQPNSSCGWLSTWFGWLNYVNPPSFGVSTRATARFNRGAARLAVYREAFPDAGWNLEEPHPQLG